MTDRPTPTPVAPAQDGVWVALAKAAVSALVLASGFHALSDDDYARLVIAQAFAHAPSLDPSGTSWLPLPFWLYGTVMAALGRDVDVARATALGLGIVAAMLVHTAARWLSLPRRSALLGAAGAAALPYAAWLGVAAVPEYPTAALILLGAAGSGSKLLHRRMLGGVALAAACLSRYEAWPVAAVFALLSLWRAAKQRAPLLALPGLIAIAGPLGWLAHGALSHGDALFFVARVTAYRKAVGGGAPSLLERLFGYPLALLRCEPEVMGLLIVGLIAAWRLDFTRVLTRYREGVLLLAALLVFLIVGDLRDGAPTHHAERPLLAILLGSALLAGDLLSRAWDALGRRGGGGDGNGKRGRGEDGGAGGGTATPDWRGRAVLGVTCVGVLAAASLVVRPWYARRDAFVDRSAELAIGKAARQQAAPDDRLLIDTPDFAFYAVIAGFARPEHAAPLDDRDPRKPRPPDPFVSEAALRARLRGSGARWLVAPRAHARIAASQGAIRKRNTDYVLVELGARAE